MTGLTKSDIPSLKHTHKYIVTFMKHKRIFSCALPDCTHYLQENVIIGKKSVCWVCGEEMIIFKPRTNPVPKKPHHKTCTRKPDKSHVKVITEVNPFEILEDLALKEE
jgi:hypothetical protein